MTEPIKVEQTATASRTRVQLRYFTVAVAGALAGRGVYDGSYWMLLAAAAMYMGPALWADYATKIKHPLLVLGAETLPDEVAQVKK